MLFDDKTQPERKPQGYVLKLLRKKAFSAIFAKVNVLVTWWKPTVGTRHKVFNWNT